MFGRDWGWLSLTWKIILPHPPGHWLMTHHDEKEVQGNSTTWIQEREKGRMFGNRSLPKGINGVSKKKFLEIYEWVWRRTDWRLDIWCRGWGSPDLDSGLTHVSFLIINFLICGETGVFGSPGGMRNLKTPQHIASWPESLMKSW